MTDRRHNDRGRFIAALVILFVSLAINGMRSVLVESLKEQRAAELEAQRTEEDTRILAAVDDVRSQKYAEEELRFSADDDLSEFAVSDKLTFKAPSVWSEVTTIGREVSVGDADSGGTFSAGFNRDLCLYYSSDEEVIEYVKGAFKSVRFKDSGEEHGQIGEARWYRLPIDVVQRNGHSLSSGFLEIVLSGRDVFDIEALCHSQNYTADVHAELLRMLNSIGGVSEAPRISSVAHEKLSDEDGTMRYTLQQLSLFHAFTEQGVGPAVIELPRNLDFIAAASPCLLGVDYDVSEPLTVSLRKGSGEDPDITLIDATGPYHGTVTTMRDVATTNTYSELVIDAQGPWSVTISPMGDTPAAYNGSTYAGDAVLCLDEDSVSQLTLAHPEEGVFEVTAAGMDGTEKLVETTTPYEGQVSWSDPHTLLVVHAEGGWKVSWH